MQLAETYDPTTLPRVVGRADALAAGFSRRAVDHRLATGRWTKVLPRTCLTVDTMTWRDRQMAALTFAGPHGLLSGAAALADHGLRSVSRPDRLLVLVPPEVTVRSTSFVRIRRTRRIPDRAFVPGPRRADHARAIADLALETRRLDDVRALVADAVRRGLCTTDELATELLTGPRRGSAFLRQAISEVGCGAWSAPESRAATLMRRAGLPAFEQNAAIELSKGRRVVVDFLWRELRAVLEIDSDAHHALAGDAARTSHRHLWLETDGYRTIHRTPRFVMSSPTQFTTDIARWLEGRRALAG